MYNIEGDVITMLLTMSREGSYDKDSSFFLSKFEYLAGCATACTTCPKLSWLVNGRWILVRCYDVANEGAAGGSDATRKHHGARDM